MGLVCSKIDEGMLQRGDHIYSYRRGRLYSHHGIYVGENRVIHFTRTEQEDSISRRRLLLTGRRCRACGYSKTQTGVVKTCLDCFRGGHRVHLFKYNVSMERYVMKLSGTCSPTTCDPPNVVVQRATEMLHGGLGFGDYSLFENNCESFALYCTTGNRSSGFQALSIKSRVKTLIHVLTGPQPFSLRKTFAQVALASIIAKSRDIKDMPKKEENHVKGTPFLKIGLLFLIVSFIMFFLGFSLSSAMR